MPGRLPRPSRLANGVVVDLDELGIDLATLRRMYELWKGGAKKSDLERQFLNKPESHGKLFTNLVRQHLGIETEQKSQLKIECDALDQEVTRLRALLRSHGIDPNEEPRE